MWLPAITVAATIFMFTQISTFRSANLSTNWTVREEDTTKNVRAEWKQKPDPEMELEFANKRNWESANE